MSAKPEQAEAKAAAIVASMTTRQLIDAYDRSSEATIRGWIQEELERRNPDAFYAWIDSAGSADFSYSPAKFFRQEG